MKKQNGFTLIELLVVVGVVALIASMVIVSVSRARAKSRDTKRVANLDAIRGALELYKDAQGTYPATTTTACWINSISTSLCTLINSWNPSLQTALQPYIQVLPSDPKAGQKYYYNATTSNYKILAILENETDTMNNDGGICDNYYEVYSLQAKSWSCP